MVVATDIGMVAVSAMMTMLGSAFATAWAQKVVGGAAVGAMAEKPELFVRGLAFMALPETIVIFGVVVAFALIGKLP